MNLYSRLISRCHLLHSLIEVSLQVLTRSIQHIYPLPLEVLQKTQRLEGDAGYHGLEGGEADCHSQDVRDTVVFEGREIVG